MEANWPLDLSMDEARELAKFIDEHGFHFGREELIGAIRNRLPRIDQPQEPTAPDA